MRRKTIIITGSNDGIGLAAAKALSEQGAQVVMVGRSPEKTANAARGLGVDYFIADFTKLSEVRTLADALKRTYPRIDVLANNAGGIFGGFEMTEDGNEKTFQVNYLAHFLLTNLLIDTLIASKATVIHTASVAHKLLSKYNVHDLYMEHGYSPNIAYGNSKLENILFSKELHRRYHSKGISSVSFHPGVVRTNFGRDTTSKLKYLYHSPLSRLFGLISPERGADTLVWLATTTPGKDWKSGAYLYKRKSVPIKQMSPIANDPETAKYLWNQTSRMLNLET